MKTYAVIKRTLNRIDYEDIKWQAKAKKQHLYSVAEACGITYKKFYRLFDGKTDVSAVVEILLDKGYELREAR